MPDEKALANNRYATFAPASIAFLRELRANNTREWFTLNKSRYEEDVLDVALDFIQSMHDPLLEFAPHFTAIPKRMGGSLMRVYRDTRFSKDKTPYKTNIGIQFRHEQAKDVHSPGYYLHIDPDEVFLGVGMWRPAPEALEGIRQRISEEQDEWRKAIGDRAFKRQFRLGGETLTRPPRGFEKDHPMIEDLKRKDFIAVKDMSPDEAVGPRFQGEVEAAFRAATPYMIFLCKAVGVPF